MPINCLHELEVLVPAPRHLLATWFLHASRVDLYGDAANALFSGLPADDGWDGERGQGRARSCLSRAQKRRRGRRRVIVARIVRRGRRRVILARIVTLKGYATYASRCEVEQVRLAPLGHPTRHLLLLQLLPLHLRLLRKLPSLPRTQRSVGARRTPCLALPSSPARVA